MPVDGANLQGANVRQVVVHADAAAQSVRPPPPADMVARALSHPAERLPEERNQSFGQDLFVQRQEENPDYSAGDALNGEGRQEGERRRKRKRDGSAEEPESATDSGDDGAWSPLGDPAAAQRRLLDALEELSPHRIHEVFREIDRSTLAGLLLPGAAQAAPGLAAYRRQTMRVSTAVEAFRSCVHGALEAAERCASAPDSDARELARKLVSIARQAVRPEAAAGRELSAFLDESLLEVSRGADGGALRATTLLAVVDSAISLWRERHNVGTVLPWSLP